VPRRLERHRELLAERLESGELLIDAAGAIVSRRRRRGGYLPKGAFILAVTDRRVVLFAATAWRLNPGIVITSWSFDDGVRLVRAPFGRLRVVLPDRSVLTLAPFGGWSLMRLAN
jgi:hypothetical protein